VGLSGAGIEMVRFVVRRILLITATLILVSIISFLVIQAPPGDFVSSYVARLEERGDTIDQELIQALEARYGVNEPIFIKYGKWIRNLFRGDLGMSFEWGQPVKTLIAERLPYSLLISITSLVFVYLVSIPIGMLSAIKQYSAADYFFTFIAFVGLAIPNFLFALICLWVYFTKTGKAVVGLFSPEYLMSAWSFAKFLDLLKHLWIPALIVGTAGTAVMVRTMRANMLDEITKPYVMVARAKGVPLIRLYFKYPFRIAINPVISTIGWTLPQLITGEVLVSLVLGIPTLAPILLKSLVAQDMYLAGSIVFILTILTLIGTLISDILLGWIDPRIRYSSL